VSGAEVVVEGVRKAFEGGRITALAAASLRLAPGEFVSLTGPSGSGKSTLLNLIGALDRPDAGTIEVDGAALAEVDAAEYRAGTVGFVFQFHNLIPTLSALENVQVPMLGRGPALRERERRARELLAEVGLAGRTASSPGVLSGGERQRVALARALANAPRLLLADEPTGALDSENGAHVLELLQRLRREHGMTVLLVTNDEHVAAAADRTLRLLDGAVTADGVRPAPLANDAK
jgi:putative ABC transport system ATP-binding protein